MLAIFSYILDKGILLRYNQVSFPLPREILIPKTSTHFVELLVVEMLGLLCFVFCHSSYRVYKPVGP